MKQATRAVPAAGLGGVFGGHAMMSEKKDGAFGMWVVCAGGYYEIRNDSGKTLANFADLMDAEVCMKALAQARLAAIDECIAVVAAMPPISCETGRVMHRLEVLKEKPE